LLFSRRGVVLGGVAVILLMCSAALYHIVGNKHTILMFYFLCQFCACSLCIT
jgi:hypothetical protein